MLEMHGAGETDASGPPDRKGLTHFGGKPDSASFLTFGLLRRRARNSDDVTG